MSGEDMLGAFSARLRMKVELTASVNERTVEEEIAYRLDRGYAFDEVCEAVEKWAGKCA